MAKDKARDKENTKGETLTPSPEEEKPKKKELAGQAPQNDDPKPEKAEGRSYKLYCLRTCQMPDGRMVEKGETVEVTFANKNELEDALYKGPVTKQMREDCPHRGKLAHFSTEKPGRPKPPPEEPKTLAEMSLGSSKVVGLRE